MIDDLITMGETLPITIGSEIPIVEYLKLKEEYSELRINIYTLLRNITSQITIKDIHTVTVEDIMYICERDISYILKNIPDAKLYGTDIVNMANKQLIPYMRVPTTVKQKWQSNIMTLGTYRLCKAYNVPFYPGIISSQYKSLFLTHLVMDVLGTSKSAILESHTGKVITKKDFYKKFARVKNRDLSVMPMTMNTLLFNGTTDVFKSPWERDVVTELHTVAIEHGWTYMTTEDIIKMHLKHSNQMLYNRFNQQPKINLKN